MMVKIPDKHTHTIKLQFYGVYTYLLIPSLSGRMTEMFHFFFKNGMLRHSSIYYGRNTQYSHPTASWKYLLYPWMCSLIKSKGACWHHHMASVYKGRYSIASFSLRDMVLSCPGHCTGSLQACNGLLGWVLAIGHAHGLCTWSNGLF